MYCIIKYPINKKLRKYYVYAIRMLRLFTDKIVVDFRTCLCDDLSKLRFYQKITHKC